MAIERIKLKIWAYQFICFKFLEKVKIRTYVILKMAFVV